MFGLELLILMPIVGLITAPVAVVVAPIVITTII